MLGSDPRRYAVRPVKEALNGMRNIDLKIDIELKQHLQEAVELDADAGLEITLVKDDQDGAWGIGLGPSDPAKNIKTSPESYVKADGLVLLITHPELAEELNGKYMDWNDTGVQLIDRD